jgi:acetyltransferase
MDKIFNPNSIVVIGVSERPTNMGRNIVANLLDFGYGGEIHVVGQREGVVFGHRIRTSVEELPQGIDLAVILTPAPTVPEFMEACGQKGIRRVVIEAGGFGEFSAEGQELSERLRAIARKWGIRFVGPNCISVIDIVSGVCLPFVRLQRQTIKKGRVSVVSQSGGITIVYTGLFSSAGLGISKAISMGNKLDLDERDYLAYLLEDENTDIICLHLESIEDGRRLMELARSSPKPILLHKTNVGQASARIAQSHTAALANDDRIVSAAARQAGMIRARNFRTTVNYAKGFSLPPVKGNTLVAISRSGGRAVVAADVAAAFGFDLYSFPSDFREKVKGFFRAKVIEPTNPLDLGDLFDFRIYVNILEECLKIEEVDAVLMTHAYSSLLERKATHRLTHAVQELAAKYDKPVALCPFAEGEEILSLEKDLAYPTFSEIDEALEALAVSRDRYRQSRKRGGTEGAEEPISISPLRSRDEIQDLSLPLDLQSGGGGGVLMTHQALEICQGYGIPVAEWSTASSLEEAVQAAERLGYPLALKVLSPHISHKSDVGGIALGIEGEEDLKRACGEMLRRMQEVILGRLSIAARQEKVPGTPPSILHPPSSILHGFLLRSDVWVGRRLCGGIRRRGLPRSSPHPARRRGDDRRGEGQPSPARHPRGKALGRGSGGGLPAQALPTAARLPVHRRGGHQPPHRPGRRSAGC